MAKEFRKWDVVVFQFAEHGACWAPVYNPDGTVTNVLIDRVMGNNGKYGIIVNIDQDGAQIEWFGGCKGWYSTGCMESSVYLYCRDFS